MLVLLPMVAGCQLGESAPGPKAAARWNGSRVELLYTGCAPRPIVSVSLIDPRDHKDDEDDPVVWQVSFDPPTRQRSFVVGELPPGGHEDVGLVGDLDADKLYEYSVRYSDGGRDVDGFVIRSLLDGSVKWDYDYVTPDEFAEATQCASSSSAQPAAR